LKQIKKHMKQFIKAIQESKASPEARLLAQKVVSHLRLESNVTLDVDRATFEEIQEITGYKVNDTWDWKWIAIYDDYHENRVDIQYRDYQNLIFN